MQTVFGQTIFKHTKAWTVCSSLSYGNGRPNLLDLKLDATAFYTGNKMVLGYIYNESRLFSVYVHNRVQGIRQTKRPELWHYLRIEDNPANHASGFVPALLLDTDHMFYRTQVLTQQIRASSAIQLRRSRIGCGHSYTHTVVQQAMLQSHKRKAIQKRAFPKEFEALVTNKPIPLNSSLNCFSLTLENKLICVEGRLKNNNLDIGEKKPIIFSKNDHISSLLVRHYHTEVKHQCRHLMEGAIRATGLWLLGGKRLIDSVLHSVQPVTNLKGECKDSAWWICHWNVSKPVHFLHRWEWSSALAHNHQMYKGKTSWEQAMDCFAARVPERYTSKSSNRWTLQPASVLWGVSLL